MVAADAPVAAEVAADRMTSCQGSVSSSSLPRDWDRRISIRRGLVVVTQGILLEECSPKRLSGWVLFRRDE